jgi:Trk K+ transport system NAD-binding subunit
MPATVLVVAVVRQGSHRIPRGPTRIEAGDVLLLFATGDDARTVEHCVSPQRDDPEARRTS